jgi:hypothetical protein
VTRPQPPTATVTQRAETVTHRAEYVAVSPALPVPANKSAQPLAVILVTRYKHLVSRSTGGRNCPTLFPQALQRDSGGIEESRPFTVGHASEASWADESWGSRGVVRRRP